MSNETNQTSVDKTLLPTELTADMQKFVLKYMIKYVGKDAKASCWDFMCAYKAMAREFGESK